MRSPRVSAQAALVCLLGCSAPLAAEEPVKPLTFAAVDVALLLSIEAPAVFEAAPIAPRLRRPTALLPLYLSFSALQVLDIHSTVGALDRGAVEANPLMRSMVGSEVGLIAVKAAGTVGVVYAGEQLWKKNKTAAIVFMVASNSAMAWVVQHNYRAAR
jgi:hypothetical protein